MGGRAAEALIFDGEVSTGASDDLQRATEIGTQMVTRYGMAETLGSRTYAPPPQPFLTGTMADRVEASEATEREIDIAVRDIVARTYDRGSPPRAPGRPRRGCSLTARSGNSDGRSVPRNALSRSADKAAGDCRLGWGAERAVELDGIQRRQPGLSLLSESLTISRATLGRGVFLCQKPMR
jgi:Peptidase family M41